MSDLDKDTRYGLLVRKIRVENGDSIDAASRKIGVSKLEITNVEDKGRSPSIMFDVKFRQTYPQSEDMDARLKRFFVEASQPRILRKCR